jgi:L-aspartate oxidase
MAIDVDFLVLGSGIAGLSFALKAGKRGKVALVTKKADTESNTNYAQGGIATVMSSEDNFESHIHDTLVAGAGLCHKDTVEILVKEGPARVMELIDIGVRFTKEEQPNGKMGLAMGREGGHSMRRIVHAADLTGREIERALVSQVKTCDTIRLFEHNAAIDLIVEQGKDGHAALGLTSWILRPATWPLSTPK